MLQDPGANAQPAEEQKDVATETAPATEQVSEEGTTEETGPLAD